MTKVITKGLIGLQDLNIGLGTFNRSTSVGGTITLNQISGFLSNVVVVDGVNFAETDVGITAAITAAGSNGTVFLSPGTYQLAATMTISATNVTLFGFSPYDTHLLINHTSDVIVNTGGQLQLNGLSFEVNTSTTRSGSYILNVQAANGSMYNCRIAGNVVSADNGNIIKLFTSTVGGWTFERIVVTAGTWDIGWYVQASSGSVAGVNFNNILTVNTATFTDSVYKFDTGSDTMIMSNCQNGSIGRGIYCLNSLAGQAPRWVHAVNCRIEAGGSGTSNVALQIDDGRDIRYIAGYLASAKNAVLLNGGTDIDISHNVFVNIGQHGIVHTATPTNVKVIGNGFEDCSVAATNTYDYVNIAAGATSFSYIGNDFRQPSANKARYVFNLLSGATASFTISDNDATQPSMGVGYLNNLASGASQNFFANRPSVNFVNSSNAAFATPTITGTAPVVAASQIGLGGTTATSANAGSNGDVPAQVVGYLNINVAGTAMKVPYYAV